MLVGIKMPITANNKNRMHDANRGLFLNTLICNTPSKMNSRKTRKCLTIFDESANFFEKLLDKPRKTIYNKVVIQKKSIYGGIRIMFETLKKVLVEELQINEDIITLDAELSSDLGINSIELADLVMICEEKFDLSIEDEDLHSFITVGDVVNYLEAQD